MVIKILTILSFDRDPYNVMDGRPAVVALVTMNSFHRIVFRTRYLSRQQSPKPSTPEDQWLLAYIKKNPFQSGAALATLYGMLVIFAYHFHIDYFPNFDLKSLASTVFAAAYTALFTLLIVSLCLFAPAYLIGTWGLEGWNEKEKQEKGALQRRIVKCFGLGFTIFLVISLLFVFIVWFDLSVLPLFFLLPVVAAGCIWLVDREDSRAYPILLDWFEGAPKRIWKWLKATRLNPWQWSKKRNGRVEDAAPSALETEAVASAHEVTENGQIRTVHASGRWKDLDPLAREQFSFVCTMTGVAFMELLSMIILVYMLRDSAYTSKNHELLELLGGLVWGGAILHFIGAYLVSAWSNPSMHPNHRVFSLCAAVAAPVLASIAIANPGLFFALTAMTTKSGNFRAAEMTLTNTGCQIIENGGEKLCIKQSDGMNKLCNVHVMSRIGTETYLLVSYPGKKAAEVAEHEKNPENKKRQLDAARWVLNVYLPSKEVLGMRVDTTIRRFNRESITDGLRDMASVCPAASPSAPPAAPPAPPAPPAQLKVPEEASTQLMVDTELFEFDQYVLKPAGSALLQRFALDLVGKNASAMSIRITGHADSIGTPYHNLQLSQMRAITVATFLRTYLQQSPHEVKNLSIDFNGMGSLQPKLADENCPDRKDQKKKIACLEPNRRVEVIVTWEGAQRARQP